jgi:hypothetical protein
VGEETPSWPSFSRFFVKNQELFKISLAAVIEFMVKASPPNETSRRETLAARNSRLLANMSNRHGR